MSAFTPGPWRWIAVKGGWDGVGSDHGEICSLSLNEPENARLIAAAPELLEALRACEENLRLIHEALGPADRAAPMPSHSTFEAWRAASEAIAKATGEPNNG